MTVKIFRPAKTAMSSGWQIQNLGFGILAIGSSRVDPLMGWTSSVDTQSQIN